MVHDDNGRSVLPRLLKQCLLVHGLNAISLPRVEVYYAVKANSEPAIVQTFYDAGASFDVARRKRST